MFELRQQYGLQLTLCPIVYKVIREPSERMAFLMQNFAYFQHVYEYNLRMKSILKKHNIIPVGVNPKINFKKYDWILFLHNYTN